MVRANRPAQAAPRSLACKQPIAFYYGEGRLETLAGYRRAVLQPANYSAHDIGRLEAFGTRTYAYLSLGEDPGPPSRWQRGELNVEWGTTYVQPLHPGWVEVCVRAVERSLALGFSGLFLDTIDIADLFPALRPDMIALIAKVTEAAKGRNILANRGFALLPELADYVDGIVFESFSTRWTHASPGYRVLTTEELAVNASLAQELARYDLELYALDYKNSHELEEFARTRASLYGMEWFASNRSLDELPDPDATAPRCDPS